MSEKKNLIVPKLQKQNLGKVNPQKAEYLYISKEFCKEGLSQIIKDGGVQFKEIQKFVKDHQEPQYILVHASKLEEGYLAISLLAGIYNEIHSRGEWEEGAEPDIQWSDSWQCLPIIPFKEADDYYNWQENDFSSFGNSFLASQKTNDTFVPYWAENEDKPVCISMENISFFRCDPIIDTLNSFRSNEQVYVLILHEENDFDSFNSFGGFGGFDTFESNEDKNLNQIILSLTAEELEIPKTSSVSLYYENIWKQMVTNSGCKLERKFPVHDFLLDIEKMNKEFSYDFLDKILKYALRNKEHGILRKKDFQFMERFAGKRGPAEQNTETRSAIRCLREDLIGMDQVKEQVMETVQVMKFNRLRKEMGMKKSSYHNVHMMLGAPGTAKTTVAKLMGKIMEEEKLLEYAALAECSSSHPISKSLQKAYGKEIDRSRVTDVEEISGNGVTAKVDGVSVAAGNEKLMEKLGIAYRSCSHVGTVVHMAVDGRYAGHILISDTVKPHAKQAIKELKKCGVKKTIMLTGDRKNVADYVAKDLGIQEVYSELLPGDKVSKVEALLANKTEKEKLAFVGDGINDAPVLSRADIGIAMGAMGSDAAIEAADIVLMDDDPLKIATAIRIARKCMHIVYENIYFAIGIKLICLLLGALGIANMWMAIFADVGVMVIAVLNAIRALFVKKYEM